MLAAMILRRLAHKLALIVGLCSVVGSLLACGGTGPYIWVDSLPASAAGGGDVLIADGDVLNVRVFNQDPLSTKERVRSDGRISIPVIGEAAAGGLTDYADGDKVFVIRKSLPQRVRFRYSDLRSQDPKSVQFTLQAGDVVVVE
jgi:protein involved in polysaccharide export with SLBB domain